MSTRIEMIFLVFCITVLIAIKYDFIPVNYLSNPLQILLTFILSAGTLIWGISGIKNHKHKRPRTHKASSNNIFLSTKFTPPEVTLSYGQIVGGIIGMLAVIMMIIRELRR